MATPVRRPDDNTPANRGAAGLSSPQQTASQVAQEPLEQSHDLGGMLIVLGAVGALLLSWTLFSSDESDGMWAGYWTTLFAIGALLGATWLRGPLPAAPGVALAALSGIGMILTGALHGYDQTIVITMVTGGALITIGAAAQAKG